MIKHLASIAALLLVASTGADTATRDYQLNGTNYTAIFTLKKDGGVFFPATSNAQPHYSATCNLFEKHSSNLVAVATGFPCTYTENGCFEDSIEALLRAANEFNAANSIRFTTNTTITKEGFTNLFLDAGTMKWIGGTNAIPVGPSEEFKLGVRYGLIAQRLNPSEDDLRKITQAAFEFEQAVQKFKKQP